MKHHVDPDWTEFSASNRKNQIFVKMPAVKAKSLLDLWTVISQTVELDPETRRLSSEIFKLLQDELEGTLEYGNKSVFYTVPSDVCRKDVKALQQLEDKDPTHVFTDFRETLEKGIRNDPSVDWIQRVGGPPNRGPLAGLEREDEDFLELSIFDLEDIDSIL